VQRDAWLDNVKMTLVTVVVIGHALPLLRGSGLNSHLYDFIYYWHIPAFVLVTGYLSRSFTWSRRHLWALFCTIVVPYFIFETAMMWFRVEVGGERWLEDLYLNPHWPMWYLAAVFLWRLATPILKHHWLFIPLSVAASLIFPLYGSYLLDLNRTIGLLPFFVVGLHLRPAWLTRLQTGSARLAGLVALVALWVFAGHTNDWVSTKWLWYSLTYDHFGVGLTDGAWIRLRLIVIALAASFAVLAVIPRRRSWYTDMGAATMVVYLFHGFFIRGAKYAGFPDWAADHGGWTLWPTIGGAICVALFLAWPPVARRLTWLVDPIGSVQRHGHPH
jgi:fucose 4-O-acetylase-like acetyltransferase